MPSPLTLTAWRQKASTVYCVTEDDINTGYKGWVTLEEYILGINTLTGNEKPNISTDANYIEPVFDETACPIIPPPPECPDRSLVFQICNSNASKDDNFDVYLNDTLIGAVNLNQNALIGSVFIASLGTPDITSADFVCPLVGMVTYYFDPALLVGGINTINMVNTQNNGNSNAGSVGVRNYLIDEITGDLSTPCVVADLVFSGASGLSFELTFDYTACCPED